MAQYLNNTFSKYSGVESGLLVLAGSLIEPINVSPYWAKLRPEDASFISMLLLLFLLLSV